MIRYRAFRNSDPPGIADVWRSQQSTRSLAQTASPAVLDQLVFSKPYFERDAFIVADDGERPVGFVHVGNGSLEDGSDLDPSVGVIALLLVAPHDQEDEIADELLQRAETYLRERGSAVIYAGGFPPLAAPYYMGLFGGSFPAGIPQSNDRMTRWVEQWGAEPEQRFAMLSRSLAGFRPIVNRDQMQIRRRYQVAAEFDPPAETWWEACTIAYDHRTRFELHARSAGSVCGQVTFWDMEPIASSWGVHACGLLDLEIPAEQRRQGLATFLLCEALRQLQSQGTTLVECVVESTNEQALAFFDKLEFTQSDEGVVYRRTAS